MRSNTNNSSEFTKKVRDLKLDDDDTMVSFDVTSLCTCVLIDVAAEVRSTALQSDASLPERTPFEVQDLRKLLQLCLENAYFVFQDCFYKQLQGTPMGASLSVSAANLTMESVERRAIAALIPQLRIFLRYVDDCFSVIKKDALDVFSSHLN
ncbi:hypothetical protein HPB52_004420 [Rhipicephalus sanguineus]|uniref:Reverse transcriptase domain-containing protein n=1 Tax=Rhipicephalus sanguineus TaxID=34632 RepID=A0A9D4PJY9_RHISA|nr:hypothetical protein HPB52_004420 [Rhipicephalus sanguineus]